MTDDPLHGWTDWNLPFQSLRLLKELTFGFTNKNYLIEADNCLCVLRINAENSAALGIDRQKEKVILEQASAVGLAPKVYFFSVEHGLLITEFIDGQHWQPSDTLDPEKLSLLITCINKIHSLDVTTDQFDYQEHEENYWRQLQDRNIAIPDKLYLERDKLLPLLARIPGSNVICHQDPNPKNIIFYSDKLYFIDWEYSAPAWPAFDFAALSIECNIPIEKLAMHTNIDIDEIKEAMDLYRYFCDLWFYLHTDERTVN